MSKRWGIKRAEEKQPDQKDIEAYANSKIGQKPPKYPWEDPAVRDRKTKVFFTLNIPEEVKVKVQYISEKTGVSQQRIMRDIVLPGVEDKLDELLGKDR